MLRLIVLLLFLANAAYFAYSQDMLAGIGLAPTQQREPHRIAQQIRPEAVRIIGGDEARRIEVASARTAECLQAGVFTDAEANSLKDALGTWPQGSWVLEPGVEPPRWIVYMGKYPDAPSVDKKRAELRAMNVSFEPIVNAELEPGLSLGGYATEAAARQQLEALTQKGVRTARVVLERPEARGQFVKFPALDEPLRARLEDIRPALAGKALRPCR